MQYKKTYKVSRNKSKTSILLKITYIHIIPFKIYFYLFNYLYLCLHSIKILSTYYVPGTVVRAVGVVMNETKF